MLLPESTLETTTRILYSVSGLSAEIRSYWTHLSKSIAEESLNPAQIERSHVMGASSPFAKSRVPDVLNGLSELERSQAVACLSIVADHAASIKDHASARELKDLLGTFISNEVTALKGTFSERSKRLSNQKIIIIPGAISILSIDFFAKWAVLIFIAFYGMHPGINFPSSTVLSITFLIIAWRRSRTDQQSNTAMIKALNLPYPWRIEIRYSAAQYGILALYAVSSFIVSFVLTRDAAFTVALTLLLTIVMFYYIMLVFFPVGKISRDDLVLQLNELKDEFSFGSDENDEAIVKLETQLHSQTTRLEAYVLESALFGALAFSGFLQIIATNLISFDDLENFAEAVYHSLHGLLSGNASELQQYAGMLDTKESLFCLVSIETLICSGLFLAVIASRLRFSNFADSIRASLSLARAFNEKEEALIHSESVSSADRLGAINKKISGYIRTATLEFDKMKPVIRYMEYFRRAGILVFLLVLVTSCLFISAFLSWAFLVMAIATLVYFNYSTAIRQWNHYLFSFKVFFASHSWVLFLATFGLAITAFVLRIAFNAHFTDLALVCAVFLFGVLLFVWLVLMPHHDEKFGDIESLSVEAWRAGRYKVVKTIYGCSILVTITGLSFKLTATTGADELLLVGLTATAMSSYALGYYLSRPKWLGIFCGMLIGTSAMGTLFKTLHIVGGAEMLNLALGAQVIFFIIYLARKRFFHYILFRLVLGMSVVTLAVSGQTSLLRSFTLMYDHGSTELAKLAEYYYQAPFAEPNTDMLVLKKAIGDSDVYFKAYNPDFRLTSIHTRWIIFFADLADRNMQNLSTDPDTRQQQLDLADESSRQYEKLLSQGDYAYGNRLLRAKVLIAQNRKTEANDLLERYLVANPTERHSDEVKEIQTTLSNLPDSFKDKPVVVTDTPGNR